MTTDNLLWQGPNPEHEPDSPHNPYNHASPILAKHRYGPDWQELEPIDVTGTVEDVADNAPPRFADQGHATAWLRAWDQEAGDFLILATARPLTRAHRTLAVARPGDVLRVRGRGKAWAPSSALPRTVVELRALHVDLVQGGGGA